MPVYPPRRKDLQFASQIFDQFRQAPQPDMAQRAREAVTFSVPMNQRLSTAIAPYVNYLVVPLFALANAGVVLSGSTLAAAFASALTWGIIAGLVVGKTLGIAGASMVVLKLSPGSRLPGLDGPRLAGVGALSGMGFTISLLVVGMAIDDPMAADQARVGVIAASMLALALSWAIFRVSRRLMPLPRPAGEKLERPVDPEDDHIRGREDAPATLVVYSPIGYDYRRRTAVALRQTRNAMGDSVRIVFRHHAVEGAEITGALALEAAAEQGRFWEMHDALVAERNALDTECVRSIAERIGLDVERFETRITHQEDWERVENDNMDMENAETEEKTLIYLNGARVDGPLHSMELVARVRAAL